jgi:hypothetical protein
MISEYYTNLQKYLKGDHKLTLPRLETCWITMSKQAEYLSRKLARFFEI